VRYLFVMPNVLPLAGWREKLLLILRRRKAFTVDGDSMSPGLTSGDKVIVDQRAAIVIGDIVLVNHPYKQNSRLIKRVTEISGSGQYFLTGDNPEESTDSRTFGSLPPNSILGKVVSRLK